MNLQIKPVTGRRELKEFVYLPARLHQNHGLWVPPIYMEERQFFDSQKNKAFSYSDTTMALASRNGQFVGRIMGIINRKHNQLANEKTARFGYLECINDQETAHALLSHVEQWAQQHGMNRIVGPMGFSDQDPGGFLIEGAEHEPTLATYYNFDYIISFLEAKGYAKEVDYIVYKIALTKGIMQSYARIFKKLSKSKHFKLVTFHKRKEIKPYIHPILHLMNEVYANLYGFVPLSEEEAEHLAKQYLPLLDPRFINVITKDDQVIAFIIGMPNINEGLRQARGHLYPFGIFKILRAAKTAKQLDLLLGGVKDEYRGLGLHLLLGTSIFNSAMEAGFEYVDSNNTLESNRLFCAAVERIGGEIYKRYRIFQKGL